MFRQNVRRIRLQHAVVPLLFTTCILPADRRRDRVSPIFRSTIKTLSGYTSLFIPTVPIPDTSKIKDRILGNLPSWATKSASSTFVKKPQADLVVALSLESKVFRVFVAYYPKGQEIIVQSGGDEEAGEDWIEIVKPEIENVDGWRYVSEVGDTSWVCFAPITITLEALSVYTCANGSDLLYSAPPSSNTRPRSPTGRQT